MKNNIPKQFYLLFIIICFIILTTCKKFEKVMLVSTGEITNISTTSAEASGMVIDLGDGATQNGHCYGKTPNVTISGAKTQLTPAGTGGFTSLLANLESGTKYYIKAYLSNGTLTVYGEEKSFITVSASVPTLTTTAITSVTTTTAGSGGNIISDGGASVTVRGVCWNTSANPTISLTTKTTDGPGSGAFTSSITGLAANTIYYVKAYATNSSGTAYGNELSFTSSAVTSTPPTAAAAAATSVTNTTTTINGAVNANGSSTSVTFEYGPTILYGSTANATPSPVTGVSPTNVDATLTGLTPGTTYHFRVKAVNAGGTVYSNDITFTTLQPPSANTVAATVVMNLTATLNGSVNANNSSSIVTFEYGLTASYGTIVTATQSPVSGSALTNVSADIGGLTAGQTYHYKVKSVSAGGTTDGNDLTFTTGALIPTLTTTTISSITQNTAASGGNITSDGGASVTARGVCWSTSTNPTIANFKTTDGTGTGTFTSLIAGLTSNTPYYVRAYATNVTGTAYGNEISFTTAPAIGDNYQGGIVAYILQPGDPGYNANVRHGLIVAPSDQSTGITWYNGFYTTTTATATAIGTGQANTTAIILSQGSTGSYAAKLCYDLVLGGYSDWYLPSKDELNKFYLNRTLIGGFAIIPYWSSTESASAYDAKCQTFTYGSQDDYDKSNPFYVRAFRAF